MGKLLETRNFTDHRGCLSVMDEEDLPFPIKRIFFISSVPKDSWRGGHAHMRTSLVLVCLRGSCKVITANGTETGEFRLDSPERMLFLEPSDWHLLTDFEPGTLLMALASESYDSEDYIHCPLM